MGLGRGGGDELIKYLLDAHFHDSINKNFTINKCHSIYAI
jgi:hypothetical protein